MNVNEAGLNLIREFEGLELEAYPDPATGGHPWTIGYGHTSAAGAPPVKKGMVITEAQAVEILRRDLAMFEKGVEKLLKVKPSENQFSAMVSLAFNVGLGNFLKSSVLKFHNQVNPIEAAASFAKWNRANGKVMKGLTRRREAERRLYSTPDAPKPVASPIVPPPTPVNPEPSVAVSEPTLWQRIKSWFIKTAP